MKSSRSPNPKSASGSPLASPASPQRRTVRPSTAGSARSMPTPSPGPRTPLRRPVSAVGKAMRKHLNDLWDDSPAKPRSRSPSPSRLQARLEAEREAAAAQAGFDSERVPYCTLEGHSQPIRSICLGPGNNVAFTAGMDGTIKVWELEYLLSTQGGECTPQPPIRTLSGHTSGVSCITLVDDQYLCSGGWDSDVKIWDVEDDYRCIGTLKGHAEFVRAIVGADGLAFSGSNDRTIKVWDLKELQCVGMMTGHSLAVLCLAVAGNKLFSGGYDFVVKVWDIATRSCIADLTGHTQVITSLVLSTRYKVSEEPGEGVVPDSHTLYSCAEDMTVRTWDLNTLTCVNTASLEVPTGMTATGEPLPSTECRPWVSCVGNDGWLWIGSREGAVMVWDPKAGKCLSACVGHGSSVRSLAMLHVVPYAESLLLSASDDGTVRVWKKKTLVKNEKEGMRLENERVAKEEALAKRRAKESLELERQRQREELQRVKDQENEVVARRQLVTQEPLGTVTGTDTFTDLPYFEGWLLHKSHVQELTVWSMGHVHGLQVTYSREGKKGCKADKHAHDLGKQMPTANVRTFEEGEEITEVSVIVSEKLVQGVIGQMRIKTTENPTDGYKFGRTTDGEELRIVTPPGMRLACFTGSCSQKGLHQLGAVFVPRMERGRQKGEGKPLTLCARAKLSLATADGRPLYLNDVGVLVASPSPAPLARGTVFSLEGTNDEFAFSRAKGHYMSVKGSGQVVEGWSARDGFSREELFEVALHATDEGDRVSVRAANGRLLAVRAGQAEVRADSLQAVEEEMLCVVARGQADGGEPGVAGRVRLGLRTAEEKEAGWVADNAEMVKGAAARQLRVLLAEVGAGRPAEVATLVWDRGDVRALMELPRLLKEVEDAAGLGALLGNVHFCCCKVATCGVGAAMADLADAGKVLRAAESTARKMPQGGGRHGSPSRRQKGGGGGVSEALAVIEGLERELEAAAAALESDSTALFATLCKRVDELPAALKAEVQRVRREAEAVRKRAEKASEETRLDVVAGMAVYEQMQRLETSGVPEALEGGGAAWRTVEKMLLDKVRTRVADVEVAIEEFCKLHMPSHKPCSPQAFGRLAQAVAQNKAEDVMQSYLRVRAAKEEGQTEQGVKDAMLAAVSSPPLPEGISVEVQSFDFATNTALLCFSRTGALGAGSPVQGVAEARADSPDHDARGRSAEEGGGEGQPASPERSVSPERTAGGASEGEASTQRTNDSGSKSGRSTGRRRQHRRNMEVLRRSESGLVNSDPNSKSVITLRDEIMARVLAGGLKPGVADVVPEPPQLKPAKIFVGGSSADVASERALLHAAVLPALRPHMRRLALDLTWVDVHWTGDDAGDGGLGGGGGGGEVSAHRMLGALRRCVLPDPTGVHRRQALLLVGQGCDREVSARELEVLRAREPEVAAAVEAAKLPMSALEFLLRQLRLGVMESPALPDASAAGDEPEDKPARPGEAEHIADSKSVNEVVCFTRDPMTITSNAFVGSVPGAVQAVYGVGVEREGLQEREVLRSRVEILLRMAEELAPTAVRKYHYELQSVAKRAAAKAGADGVLWDTVSLSGLSEAAEQAEDEEMWSIKIHQLLDQMTFELPVKFTHNDIDPNFSYLSNRGSNAVVTYKGERAQLAAALATQKHQIRMATNVKVVMKGHNVPAPGQERALCDDKDMTLVEVKGIPKGTSEADVLQTLSVALKEVSLHPGTKEEGELSGYVGVTYESSEAAADVRGKLSGVPFKYLRPAHKDDVRLGGVMSIERHESDPTGYLKVSGLPYNVDMEAVQNLFHIAPVAEWSCLRKDRASAVLAFRHSLAASLVVLRLDRSRPWGGTGDKLTVQLVDPAMAVNRVYLCNVPLMLNDKIVGDHEKALKDLLSKEKDLFHAMTHLQAKPIPAHSRVYSRYLGEGGERRVTYAGDARVGYVHAALGKVALGALQKEENSLVQYGQGVEASLALSVPALAASLRFSAVDQVRLALRAYKAMLGAGHRLYAEYPWRVGDLHEVARADQAAAEAEIVGRSCVAGYSMGAEELSRLTDFLTEMCALFRGDEGEWLLVDGALKRSELRHRGDGVRNLAVTQVTTAISEKKGTVVVVYGEAGAGATTVVARVASQMKAKALADSQEEKNKAAAAAKTKTKKKAPARPTAPAVLPGGAKKEEGAGKKKGEGEKKSPEAIPSWVVVSYYRRPWSTLAEMCSYLIREVWKDYKVKAEDGSSSSREREWAREALRAPAGEELAVLRQALTALLAANLNATVGLVLDGLSEAELQAVCGMLVGIKGDVKQSQYKLWCVASMTVTVEDPEIDEKFFPVKLQPLSKPEATAVLYDAVLEFGPHLLRKHVRVFMGMFKTQCWHPRYLRMLALYVCHQEVFFRLTQDINAIKDTLPALFASDILPWLEREFNAGGREFSILPRPSQRRDAAAQSRHPGAHNAVEQVLKLLLHAGDGGVFLSDFPALVPLPGRVLEPLVSELLPMLACGYSLGRLRVAMTCPALREAVVLRYWPSGLHIRGSGCTQLTQPLPPTHSPLRAAFGKHVGSFPVVVVDVVDPYRLDTVKRLLVRLLAELAANAARGEMPTSFNLLSCSSDAPSLAEAMVEVDGSGGAIQAAAEWLSRLQPGGNRLEWTAAFELVGTAGFGHDNIFLLSDRTPGLSVERILDEVRHLESELGHGAKVVVHCNGIDAEPGADKMLRRVASDTGGRFARLSAFVLRQQLLGERAGAEVQAWEAAAGCTDPGAQSPVKALMEGGRAAGSLMLAPPRAVSVLTRGELEDRLTATTATERGLSLLVLSRDLAEKHNKTYDTWGNPEEAAALANVLQGLTTNELVVLTSFDAWERNFDHQAANALSRCGIDGRRMLKKCEEAKASWDALSKRLGADPSDDARPEGHGYAVAAIGIPGRKPWGRTELARDLGTHSPPAEISIALTEIAEARKVVETKESEMENQGRIVGVCKVVTPFRWSHEAGAGQGYNILPGHSFAVPTQDGGDRSLSSVLAS